MKDSHGPETRSRTGLEERLEPLEGIVRDGRQDFLILAFVVGRPIACIVGAASISFFFSFSFHNIFYFWHSRGQNYVTFCLSESKEKGKVNIRGGIEIKTS